MNENFYKPQRNFFLVRQQISAANLRVVGWYHSHPTFKPIPSNVDVTNQHNYQVLFKNTASEQGMYSLLSFFDFLKLWDFSKLKISETKKFINLSVSKFFFLAIFKINS